MTIPTQSSAPLPMDPARGPFFPQGNLPMHFAKRCLRALTAVAVAALATLHGTAPAQQSLGYAEYYLLGDEANVVAALKTISGTPVPTSQTAANMNSRLSIVSSANNVQVFLD